MGNVRGRLPAAGYRLLPGASFSVSAIKFSLMNICVRMRPFIYAMPENPKKITSGSIERKEPGRRMRNSGMAPFISARISVRKRCLATSIKQLRRIKRVFARNLAAKAKRQQDSRYR